MDAERPQVRERGGEPLPGSDLRPRWTLTPEEHRHPLGELTGQLAEGVLTLSHVPAGRYGVWLVVAAHDASRDTPQDAYRPGDFWGAADGVAVPAAGAVELPLCRLVHVTAPHDNATRLPFRFQGVDSVPALESPVRFAWDPLPLDGVEYVVEVGTVDYDTQTASIGTVARVRTGEHEASVELAPSQGNRAYSFHLRAERGGRLVGRTSFTSLGVRDWNYEFRVVQRR